MPPFTAAKGNKMVIEFAGHDEGRVCLVHWNELDDALDKVKHIVDQLLSAQPLPVVAIYNGKPCSTNPLPKLQIFNGGNRKLLSVIEKISAYTTPGEMIPLTEEEFYTFIHAQEVGEIVSI